MNTIEIANSTEFEFVKIYVNNTLISENYSVNAVQVDIGTALPAEISVEFKPFKIKPIVRYNNIMLNYWLANILLQDHMVSFTVTVNFFQDYRKKDIQGRIDSLPPEQQTGENLFDKYVGVDNLYPELVAEIKKLIN